MDTTTKQRGQSGEDAAAQFLQKQGYRIVARNWRPGNALRGEVDCIAWHGKTLCFIEVKTRSSNAHGTPQEAVGVAKQRQLSRLANAYVALHRLGETPCRFDVVEVWLAEAGPRLAVHQNAFDFRADRRGARLF